MASSSAHRSPQVADCVALVTGGNRGIGQAFVEELLAGGARRVYCGARNVDDVPGFMRDAGVVPVPLDITDVDSVTAAAAACPDVTVLVNNAGFHGRDRLVLTEHPEIARQEMEVNYFGTLNMIRAFAPVLAGNGGGAIVNVLSVAGAIPTAFMGGYSPAKSAALFLSTIARAELDEQGTSVTALIVGSVDTRMADHVEGSKEDPRDIAKTGLRAMMRGERTVDTDRMAYEARSRYALDPARYERGMAKVMRSGIQSTGR
ncbi:MAG TPA: SDR family oxidoreductase [Jatrophihabitans sp.]|jgi:NAD(P)-dependent dehydrogenase (short-subunit alcohol dehydrogenase family)|uniref:SDR family oxidoreductase n=1 Tax=Jatrophihabitans sp. TaxID=1932789 RepID=UPI002DF9D965|nr:SDR family oxidoreductase [Jatrophihabitans sp.]